MGYPTKIATCSYCGTRAALVLKGRERHELACSACGAPLHDLKFFKAPPKSKSKSKDGRDYGISHRSPPKDYRPSKKDTRKRKRKGGFRRFLEEAFDVIEDIID
ncbi:MAG: hypothetical protein AAGP08_17145 [Pseudomonadota bacterium]